jgi:hypothetical protein
MDSIGGRDHTLDAVVPQALKFPPRIQSVAANVVVDERRTRTPHIR